MPNIVNWIFSVFGIYSFACSKEYQSDIIASIHQSAGTRLVNIVCLYDTSKSRLVAA